MSARRAGTSTLCALLLAAGLGACGGSSDGGTAAASSSAPAPAPTVSGAAGAAEARGFCAVLGEQASASRTAPTVTPTGAALKTYVEDAEKLNQRLLASAPASIKKDLAVSVGLSTLSGQVALDPTRSPELQAKLKDPAVIAANQRVSAYATSVCDIAAITGSNNSDPSPTAS